jgi:hypothetical protein
LITTGGTAGLGPGSGSQRQYANVKSCSAKRCHDFRIHFPFSFSDILKIPQGEAWNRPTGKSGVGAACTVQLSLDIRMCEENKRLKRPLPPAFDEDKRFR